MEKLMSCSRCEGFLGSRDTACPHCGTPPSRTRRRRFAALLGLAGSASLGITMMACYGAPPGDPGTDPNPDASGSTTDGAGGAGGAPAS